MNRRRQHMMMRGKSGDAIPEDPGTFTYYIEVTGTTQYLWVEFNNPINLHLLWPCGTERVLDGSGGLSGSMLMTIPTKLPNGIHPIVLWGTAGDIKIAKKDWPTWTNVRPYSCGIVGSTLILERYTLLQDSDFIYTYPEYMYEHIPASKSLESAFESSALEVAPIIRSGSKSAPASMARTFYNNPQLVGEVSPYWSMWPSLNGTDCFYGCTALSNYADIPADWK